MLTSGNTYKNQVERRIFWGLRHLSKKNDLYHKDEGHVGQLCQTRIESFSFSFSLSVTFHPVISMSLSYKSSVSPSVVSKSSSVTCVTDQISFSSPPPSSVCVFLLPLKNLLWAKLRDYAISRVKPNPRQAFLLQVVKLI